MDPNRFDAVTKAVASASSRRTMVRGLAAAVGGLVGAVGARRAGAVTVQCCSGTGGHAGNASGGTSSTCCAAPQQCYSRNGRGITCPIAGGGVRYSAEGGRAGCCLPSDTACQQRIQTPPPCPTGCTCT